MNEALTAPTAKVVRSEGWTRVGAWSGVLFVGTFAAYAAVVLGAAPAVGDSVADVRAWMADNGSTYMAFMWITGVALVALFLPFATALARLLEEARPDDASLARLVTMGAVGVAVVGTLGNASYSALALGSAMDLADASVAAFIRVDSFTFLMAINLFQALVAGAAGAAILRSGTLSRALGWSGVSIAALLLIAGSWVFGREFGDFYEAVFLVALSGFALWIAASAIAMLRSVRSG